MPNDSEQAEQDSAEPRYAIMYDAHHDQPWHMWIVDQSMTPARQVLPLSGHAALKRIVDAVCGGTDG